MESLSSLLQERKRRQQTARMEASLAEFFREAWREVLERDRRLTWSFHYDFLCETLEMISSGDFKRQHPELLGVIICVPPRTSKSGLVTVAWPAWAWIRQPSLRFLCASYSGTLSADHSIKRRNLITSPWFQSRWASRFALSGDLNRTDDYANDQTGRITATSVGGSVTGLGGDICIGDDLLNQDDQFSEAARKATNRWIDGTWTTKLNNPSTGVFVYVSQRNWSGQYQQRPSPEQGGIIKKFCTILTIVGAPWGYRAQRRSNRRKAPPQDHDQSSALPRPLEHAGRKQSKDFLTFLPEQQNQIPADGCQSLSGTPQASGLCLARHPSCHRPA